MLSHVLRMKMFFFNSPSGKSEQWQRQRWRQKTSPNCKKEINAAASLLSKTECGHVHIAIGTIHSIGKRFRRKLLEHSKQVGKWKIKYEFRFRSTRILREGGPSNNKGDVDQLQKGNPMPRIARHMAEGHVQGTWKYSTRIFLFIQKHFRFAEYIYRC